MKAQQSNYPANQVDGPCLDCGKTVHTYNPDRPDTTLDKLCDDCMDGVTIQFLPNEQEKP